MHISTVALGAAAGLLIGLTGVGAGSLMTPLLLTLFRLPLPLAIGTDLGFAGLTKLGGALSHHRHGHVDRRLLALLLSGSVPGALLTLLGMAWHGHSGAHSATLSAALGFALLLTSLAIAGHSRWQGLALRVEPAIARVGQARLTVLLGAALGVLVTLSSVGAGAIGTTVIVLLYPRLPAQRLVGTDIAHAVPLTLIAGLGHAALGHVAWPLLLPLLLGSLPGIWVGAQLVRRIPTAWTRALLSVTLLAAGLRIIA